MLELRLDEVKWASGMSATIATRLVLEFRQRQLDNIGAPASRTALQADIVAEQPLDMQQPISQEVAGDLEDMLECEAART